VALVTLGRLLLEALSAQLLLTISQGVLIKSMHANSSKPGIP
jgi:hypothetical protein